MSNCIFCNISKTLLDNKNIYLQSDKSFAVFDINPVTKGHALVISKAHYPNIMECPDDVLADAIKLSKEVALKLMKDYPNIKGFNYQSNQNADAGQVIFHLHIHIIPRY